MKTLRRLALLALFGLAAGTAAAGPPPGNGGNATPPAPAAGAPAGNAPATNEPVGNAPIPFTAADLGKLLKDRHKSVEEAGEGDAKTFNLTKLAHVTENGKETLSWSVSVKLHQRASRSPAVRIFFPCQAMPAESNTARLEELMAMNGAIKDSQAYFVIGGSGKDRMLYLVSEESADGLTAGGLETAIKELMRAAERTTAVWGTDLTKPPAKKEVK